MKTIDTIIPIPVDKLKLFFEDSSIVYNIDYNKSKLKKEEFFTYVSNIDVNINIQLKENNIVELMHYYLRTSNIVNILSLEELVVDMLMRYKGLLPPADNKKVDKIIRDNLDILGEWNNKIESMVLFNIYCINSDSIKSDIESKYPHNKTKSLQGVNFISLFKHKFFYYLLDNPKSILTFYDNYFKESMFNGKNLFHYWNHENNPMLRLTNYIGSGISTKEYYQNKEKYRRGEIHAIPF